VQLTVSIPDTQSALRLPPGVLNWSEEEFFRFCQANRELRVERTAKGEILVMSPAGGYSGYQSGEVFGQLRAWAERDGTGVAFDSSTGFSLPNGAMRAPDAAWVRRSRLEMLSAAEKSRFLPLCPDFAIEVASPTDELPELRTKMEEYRECGLRLGWLILPASAEVEIYTPGEIQYLQSPEALSGEPVLGGFVLDLTAIWNPPF
jgi:Uma2 family endonuclease